MARTHPAAPPVPGQLTLDDWAELLQATPAAEPSERREPVAALADALAPRLAEALRQRLPQSPRPRTGHPRDC